MTSLSMQRDPATNGNREYEAKRGDSVFDILVDKELRDEMRRLAGQKEGEVTPPPPSSEADRDEELRRLQIENQRLREMVERLQDQPPAGSEQDWIERQKEYENLLDEKSEVIRMLHQKIHKLENEASSSSTQQETPTADEQELLALQEQLEQERAQLREDEEDMMKQMKEMELSMSRERAMLARERAEIRRLHDDLTHEIEMASRDGQLRERLSALQRRQQQSSNASGSTGQSGEAKNKPEQEQQSPGGGSGGSGKKGSGLLRRLFGPS